MQFTRKGLFNQYLLNVTFSSEKGTNMNDYYEKVNLFFKTTVYVYKSCPQISVQCIKSHF